jgi:hypothetical protein
VCAFCSLPRSELALSVPHFSFSSARRLPGTVQELIAISYPLLLGSDRLLGECLLAVDFCLSLHWVFSPSQLSFPCRFSFWHRCSALDFPAGDWFRVSRFFGLSVESLALPSLISLDPGLAPVIVFSSTVGIGSRLPCGPQSSRRVTPRATGFLHPVSSRSLRLGLPPSVFVV